ncbi:MAG TPA: hypothetical protein VLA09_02035 [Longimicrobiales bacterium]|nr:hypothetical protein [Longimicrobiales bacterium]
MSEMRWRSLTGFPLALCLLVGCGEVVVDADPAVAPFVGTWDASVYRVWPDANPEFVVDVLEDLGPFHLTVEPSGQYTAVIEDPRASPEIGQLTVIGSTIRLDPTTPESAPVATATFSFTGSDRLTLDGATQIDFNDDGVKEAAQSHIELTRR